jgi:hypothetical protein
MALIYDDLGDRDDLLIVLHALSGQSTWPGRYSFKTIRTMVDARWRAYMELKTQLESVLWGLWMLDEERQWRGTFEDFVRFYAKEGNIRFGLFEIASLLPFPLFPSPLRTRSPTSAYYPTMTKPSISHTLLSWKHGSNPSLLLWDTVQENHPELSSAMEVLLRKISPTSEVFDRKLRSLEEVLFLTTGPLTRLRAEDPEIRSIGQHTRDSCRLLAFLRPRAWNNFDDIYLLLSNVEHDIETNNIWVGFRSSEDISRAATSV